MRSPQTLSEDDRRLVAGWAADCAERVLAVFESIVPGDDRPRVLIARARAFARGDLDTATGIRRRFEGGVPERVADDPAALAAARAAGQAAAVCHMGAHGLGAAAYAAHAVGLANRNRPDAAEGEIHRQIQLVTPPVHAALCLLPRVGENASGPLGPGLLSSGTIGEIIGKLQDALAAFDVG